jgi:hypothetical protein
MNLDRGVSGFLNKITITALTDPATVAAFVTAVKQALAMMFEELR